MIERVRCLRDIFLTVTASSMVPEAKKRPPSLRLTAVLFACAPIAIRAFANFCTGIKFVRLSWWPIILLLAPWNLPENEICKKCKHIDKEVFLRWREYFLYFYTNHFRWIRGIQELQTIGRRPIFASFLPVQKAQTPLSCLAYRQIKPQRSEGRRPCLQLLYITKTP